jgi:Flp pilus assembly pilin Flp
MNISQIRRKKQQRGQGMTEYIIIVALIAVSAITVYASFGKTIRNQTAGLAKEMSGQAATTDIQTSQDAATKASSDGSKNKGLGSYDSGDLNSSAQ